MTQLPNETNTSSNTRVAAERLKASGTPYGDLTTVDRDNRIDLTAEFPLSEQNDIVTSGVTHDPTESVYRIRANASTESLETVDTLQYTPGYIAEVGVAIQIPEAPTGSQEVRWGYWNDTNGVYFGLDSEGVFAEQLRTGTRLGKERGLVGDFDIEQVIQNGSITRLILALYNYGSIGFQLFSKQGQDDILDQNTVFEQNIDGQTTLAQQNLPIRIEVDNPDSSDFDVFVADRQATVRGQFTASRRLKSESLDNVSLNGTTWVPIMTIRKKTGFETVTVGVFNIDTIPSDDIYLQIRSNAGSDTDGDYATPSNIGAEETAIEVDTTPTASISDGFHRYQTTLTGGQGASTTLGQVENVDVELDRDRPFTLFARKVSGSGGTLEGTTFGWAENW